MDGLLQPTNNLQNDQYKPQPTAAKGGHTRQYQAPKDPHAAVNTLYPSGEQHSGVSYTHGAPQAQDYQWQSGQSNVTHDPSGIQAPEPGVLPAPEYNPPATGSPAYTDTVPYETVEDRLTNLLKKDNPYLLQARSSAERQAASRGLQNSTMAATAGESAAIQHALPIAQQDAGFFQNRHLQDQQTQQQAHLYGIQGGISSQLQHQGFQQQQQLQTDQQRWQAVELQAKINLDYDRMGQDDKLRLDQAFDKINADHQRDMLEISMNPNFATQADRDAAMANLNRLTELRIQTLSTIYKVPLTWEPPQPMPEAEEKEPEEEEKPIPAPVDPRDAFEGGGP